MEFGVVMGQAFTYWRGENAARIVFWVLDLSGRTAGSSFRWNSLMLRFAWTTARRLGARNGQVQPARFYVRGSENARDSRVRDDTSAFPFFVDFIVAAAGGRIVSPPYPAASGSNGISRASWDQRVELRYARDA